MGFDTKIIQGYYEYMVDVAVIFGAEREEAEEQLKESLLFEMTLANVSQIISTYIELHKPYRYTSIHTILALNGTRRTSQCDQHVQRDEDTSTGGCFPRNPLVALPQPFISTQYNDHLRRRSVGGRSQLHQEIDRNVNVDSEKAILICSI